MTEEERIDMNNARKPYEAKLKEAFGRRLKREMERAKFSRESLAYWTLVTPEDMRKYMNGEEFPPVEILLRICNQLQIMSMDLLGT